MFNEKISIITASYNYAQYISECIESVIAQTYQNWELIIVDDGSTDNSVEIIQSYCKKDNRIKLYQHKNGQNKGLKDTILLGLKQANSEWIAFLESDDKFLPNYLEEKIKIIDQEPNVKLIFNNFETIGDVEFKSLPYYISFQKEMPNNIGFHNYLKEFYTKNPIPTFSVVMIKKSVLISLNFSSPIKPSLDRFLWSQVAIRFQFYYIDKKLTYWRKHKESYSTTFRNDYFLRFIFYLKTSLYIPDLLINKISKIFFILKLL